MLSKKMRLLTFVMAIVVTLSILPAFGASADDVIVVDVVSGDANADGVVNMKDVLVLRLYLAGIGEPNDWYAADATGDADVNMKDVLAIRKHIADIETLASRTYTIPVKTTATAAPTETAVEPTETAVEPTETGTIVEPTETAVEPTETGTIVEPTETGVSTEPTTAPTTKPTKPEPSMPANAREDWDPKSGIDYDDPAINFIEGTNKTLGVWWWVPQYNESTIRSYMELFKKNQVTEIYYESYSMLSGSSASRSQLHAFVKIAAEYGMRVASLYDDQASINGGGPFNGVVNGFIAYKNEYPDDALYAIHCDIEPKASAVKTYVRNFIPMVAAAREKGVPIELDLNCGWESIGREIEYNGITGIYNIIAANCDCMCLMSYRDKFADIYGCATNIIPAAEQYGTKVVFGIELGYSGEGDQVDFHDEGIYTAWSELYKLNNKVNNRDLESKFPVGYAIHSETTMKSLPIHWGVKIAE